MKKGLLYLFVFLFMAALACKSSIEAPKPAGVWEKGSSAQNELLGILELKENSLFIFTAKSEGHTDSHGKYSILDSQITFEDDTCYTPGTYEYMLGDNQLTLEIISDSCQQRGITLSGTWSRQSPQE